MSLYSARLFLCLALSGCVTGKSAEEWEPHKDQDSGKVTEGQSESRAVFEILAAVYREPLKSPKVKGRSSLLVPAETIPVTRRKSLTFPQDEAALRRYVSAVPKACITSFIRANKQRYALPAPPSPPGTVELVPLSNLNQLFHTGGWSAVLKAFPKTYALVSVSRLGTCHKRDEALLFLQEARGDGGGRGVLVHAKNSGDGWAVEKQAVISQADALED